MSKKKRLKTRDFTLHMHAMQSKQLLPHDQQKKITGATSDIFVGQRLSFVLQCIWSRGVASHGLHGAVAPAKFFTKYF